MVTVVDFGAGPGLYLDLARLTVQLPAAGSSAARVDVTAVPMAKNIAAKHASFPIRMCCLHEWESRGPWSPEPVGLQAGHYFSGYGGVNLDFQNHIGRLAPSAPF